MWKDLHVYISTWRLEKELEVQGAEVSRTLYRMKGNAFASARVQKISIQGQK